MNNLAEQIFDKELTVYQGQISKINGSAPEHLEEFHRVVEICGDKFPDIATRIGCYAYFLHGIDLGKKLAS